MNARKEALSLAYKRLCEELSSVLYDEDPAGMGSNIEAPRDEYDEEAARIAALLCRATSRQEIVRYMERNFGKYSSALVERVDKALAKFRML